MYLVDCRFSRANLKKFADEFRWRRKREVGKAAKTRTRVSAIVKPQNHCAPRRYISLHCNRINGNPRATKRRSAQPYLVTWYCFRSTSRLIFYNIVTTRNLSSSSIFLLTCLINLTLPWIKMLKLV